MRIKRTRNTTVFVYHHEIRHFVRSTGFYQFLHDVVSSIYTVRIRKDETKFLPRGVSTNTQELSKGLTLAN